MDSPIQRHKIAVTGCGWVTPVAVGNIETVLAALGPGSASTTGPASTVAESESRFGTVPDALLDGFAGISKEIRQDKGAWMTAVAVECALRDAGLDPSTLVPERLGMVLGCALAGQSGMIQFAGEVREQSARFVSPINFPQTVGNFIAGAIARGCGVRGPNLTLAAGAASGLDAICEGCALLQSGRADVILAGGTDALTLPLVVAYRSCIESAVHAAGGVWDRTPDISEGACWVALERVADAARRGSNVLAEVEGWSRGLTQTQRTPEDGAEIITVAGFRQPGAMCIDESVGFCLGAAGAGALAAAIGAARRLERGSVTLLVLAGDSSANATRLRAVVRRRTEAGCGPV